MSRPALELLTKDEQKALLELAEQLWADLQDNRLGGYSDGNRPFYIEWKFRRVIEQFGHRDTGLNWTQNQIDTAAKGQSSE